MERIFIEDLYEVAEMMYNRIIETDAESVAFVGFYEDAIDLIKNLMDFEDTDLYQVTLEPEEWDGYDKEYLVTLD